MRSVLILAALLFSCAASADEGPRYTYGEIGYSRLDIDNYSGDGDFADFDVSLALTDLVHVFATYSDGTVGSSPDIDVRTASGGVGLNIPLDSRHTVDLVLDAAYLWTEVDGNFFNALDDDGYGLSAGVRAMLNPNLEVNGGVAYTDVNEDDTAVYAGVVYKFTDLFAVTGGVSAGDNATSYGVGVRLYFGR